MKYRHLHGYKYELLEDEGIWGRFPSVEWNEDELEVDLEVLTQQSINTDYIKFNPGICLIVKAHYAWDGCSGPTIDRPSNMRAGLFHDALYQLMREGLLNRKHRKEVDQLFYKILLEDGFPKFMAGLYYQAVRIFGDKNSKPEKNPRGKVVEIL